MRFGVILSLFLDVSTQIYAMNNTTANVLAGVGVVTVIILVSTAGYLILKKKAEE